MLKSHSRELVWGAIPCTLAVAAPNLNAMFPTHLAGHVDCNSVHRMLRERDQVEKESEELVIPSFRKAVYMLTAKNRSLRWKEGHYV